MIRALLFYLPAGFNRILINFESNGDGTLLMRNFSLGSINQPTDYSFTDQMCTAYPQWQTRGQGPLQSLINGTDSSAVLLPKTIAIRKMRTEVGHRYRWCVKANNFGYFYGMTHALEDGGIWIL